MGAIDSDALKEYIKKTDLTAVERGALLQAISNMPTLTPPNEPLTLEELRRMDGEPVWVSYHNRIVEDRWYIIEKSTEAGLHVESHPYFYLGWDIYGKFWLAYRRPPEEEEET